jgi:hypothetical protein
MPEVLNTKFPIVDTLAPLKKIRKEDLNFLTKKELKELRKASVKSKGIKLSKDSISNYTLFPAEPIFKAFQNFDSASSKLFENQSYYLLSTPLFFSKNTKALIHISLIRGYGSLYILEKKEGNWKVVKSIFQWM